MRPKPPQPTIVDPRGIQQLTIVDPEGKSIIVDAGGLDRPIII